MMIGSAFGVQNFQIVGGPSWLATDGYDVAAKAGDDAPPARLFAMVRQLLEERFHLSTHREERNLPIYALARVSPGSLGDQLRPSTTDCSAPAAGRPRCGISMNFGEVGGAGATLAQLANSLGPFTGRLVQDRTETSGTFDFELRFTPDAGAFPAPPGQAPSDDRPSLSPLSENSSA